MEEQLAPRAITLVTQSLESSCVPASVSMVFSGFGIDIDEQTLIGRYFPTAALPDYDRDRGVTNTNTVKGIVQIIEDLGLKDRLQVDVFVPDLYEYTRSPEERYIVKAKPRVLQQYGKNFEEGTEVRIFFETLADLLKANKIGIYTANARMLQIQENSLSLIPQVILYGFYTELTYFISRGHIVGPHGGGTAHARALDGTRMEDLKYRPRRKGFVVLDPRGESYAIGTDSLVWVDSGGVRGDVFDYLFRVSPRENELEPQTYGFRRFLLNLRKLIP